MANPDRASDTDADTDKKSYAAEGGETKSD